MTSSSGPATGGRTDSDVAISEVSSDMASGDASRDMASGDASGDPTVRAEQLAGTVGAPGGAGSSGFDAGARWARYLPAVVALAFSLWGSTTPSFWRDEAATLAAVRRPFGDLITMLGNVDAVHAAYYIMVWPLVQLAGASEFVVRLPSAVAMAVAAAAVAAIGRRLISSWAGLLAGLMFAVLPAVSRYGQEARSYAMVIAVAAIASYLLVRVIGAAPERRRRWLMAYGASLAAVGILNIFALLLIPAHAVTLVLQCRRAGGRESRRLLAGWLAAAAVSVVVASPLLVLGWSERGQISWLTVNKSSSGIGTLLTLDGSILVTFAVVAVIGIALVVGSETGRERLRREWPRPLVNLAVPWLILPPVILLTGSLITPLYTSRYILMCLPALALIGGAAMTALGRVGGPVALVAVLLAGLTAQLAQRAPAGHYDDIRSLDHVLVVQARPGDVVLYTNPNAESFGAAYPYGLDALHNIALRQAAIPSGTLAGTTVPLAVIRQRLAHVSRVWIVEINKEVLPPEVDGMSGSPLGPALVGLPFHRVKIWREHGDWLLFYARD
jgi:mannosyltransferase